MHVKIRPKHSPNKAQEFMVLVIFASFPAAFASETDGRSITQAQLQSTPGNKKHGKGETGNGSKYVKGQCR